MKNTQIQLLNTFVLVKEGTSAIISSKGCSEMFEPYPAMPPHIRGIIKFQAKLIPVVDFACQLINEKTEIDLNTCLLVIRHSSQADGRTLYSAILIRDFDEVLLLSQADFCNVESHEMSFNANYVVQLAGDLNTDQILGENHKILAKCASDNKHKQLFKEELIPA